ncbi:MAG: hypothetical protein FWD08_07495, partial [Alphaproteobacteria bacterium]|nr:hypothetical protein [Alphaproteobacteria bacterium]
EALDLDPLPPDLVIPMQGPTRSVNVGGGGKGERGKEDSQKGGGGLGGGMGMGGGVSLGPGIVDGTEDSLSPNHHL